jgi:hypothetical protein
VILHLAAALGLRMLLTQGSPDAPRVFLDAGTRPDGADPHEEVANPG